MEYTGHNQQKLDFQSSNQSFVEPNVLQLRLDTQQLLTDIHVFLIGKRLHYMETPRGIEAQYVKEGEARCNEKGAQALVGWLTTQLNSAVVQGNWLREDYQQFLCRTRKELAKILLENGPRWNVRPDERLIISSGIMNGLQGFMSRLIDNKERESYAHSLASRGMELLNPNQEKKKWL